MLHSFPCLPVFNLSIALCPSHSVKFSQQLYLAPTWLCEKNGWDQMHVHVKHCGNCNTSPTAGDLALSLFYVLVSVWSVLLFFLPLLIHSLKTNTLLLEYNRVLSWKMHVTLEQRYGKWGTQTHKNTRSLSWQRANREPLRLMAGTILLRVICNHSGLEGEEKIG